MSKADELIAGLTSNAEFDSEGAFSLDREKARQKMRQFQLADPHRYVLLLVEAAVLRGASEIAFEIDTDDMHMRFDAALEWEDLDELYTSLFVDRTTTAIRARRELALACNAAMALNPRWIRIESYARKGEAVTGVRGLLRPDEQDQIEPIEQPPAGVTAPSTHIHVKERFRPGLLVRFLHTIGDVLREAELIRSRCRMASVRVTLDGHLVSFGLPNDPVAGVSFEAEGLRGVAGLNVHERERSAVVLISNGVEISTTDLNDSVPGLWFWVDSSGFRKDVSQAAIVRNDPGYEAMLRAIAKARDRTLGRLVQMWAAGEFNHHPELPAAVVFNLLRKCFLRWADLNWLHADAGPLGRLSDLPLWRTVDRRWLSPRALVEEADPERGIMYTHRDFEGVQPLGWGPVIHVLDGLLELDAIKRVYTEAVVDVSEDLAREVPWELNRRRWRTRAHAPELPRGAGSRVIDIAADGYVGQVVARPGQRSDVRFIVDGCLLGGIDFDLGTLGISAIISGPFEPKSDFTGPAPTRELATGAMLILAQIPHLLGEHATSGLAKDLLRYALLAITFPDFPNKWLEAFGFEARAAIQMVARIGAPNLLPELGLGAGQPTMLAHMLSFPTVGGGQVTLAQIDADRRARTREQGKVLYVDQSAEESIGEEPELRLRLSMSERWLLIATFGAARMHDDTTRYRAELGRRKFERKPELAPSLTGVTWQTTIAATEAGVSGLVGINAIELRDWKGDEPRKAKIDLLYQRRQLTTLEERAWVPGVRASLEWREAPVNASFDGLDGSSRPLDLRPLHDAINSGVTAILESLAREAIASGGRPGPEVRRLLWMSMATPFLSAEHAAAWRRLRAELEPGPAVEAYFELLRLFPTVTLSDMRESIKLLLEADRTPTRAAVLEILDRRDPGPGGGREFQRAVLDRYALFEEVPLIELTSGAAISLARLSQHYATSSEIAYVQDPSLHYESDEYMIVRADPVDHVALLRLFGRECFNEVSAWIHERRHQERFETQTPLKEIRVANHSRLVGVEFERDGVTGELAIPPWVPGDTGVMKLVFCHQRRVVQEIELHAKQPVLGILDDPEAPLSADFRSVDTSSARMAKLRKLLDSVLDDELLPALAEAYASFDPPKQSLARAWVVDHWRRSSPRAGQFPNRLSAAGRKFAELPLFCDVDGAPRSLAELSRRYAEQRKLWYVHSAPGHSVAPAFPIVLCRADELELLRELFEECEDYGDRWRDRVRGERRRERAKPLPSLEPPRDVLVAATVERHGLTGALWLPDRVPFDSGVILGSHGKVVSVRDFVEQLPVQGAVDGVETDDAFEQPELSGPQTRYLDARAIFLYAELLNHHHRDIRQPERPSFREAEAVRLRGVRIELLRRAAIALGRARRQGVGMDAILRNFERRIEAEPLFELASGRLISLEVARQARPHELAHLDIWDPSGPELDPSERARLLLGEPLEAKLASEPATESTEPDDEEPIAAQSEPSEPGQREPAAAPIEPADLSDLVAAISVEAAIDRELELEPPPPPPPPEPLRDYVGEVLERVREELRLLRERHEIVLTEAQLDCITADVRNGRELVRIEDGVVFDSAHERFVRAMEDPDPIWVSFLASVAYTALNRWLDEVTDADELVFHQRHAEHLLSGLLS